jgi:hypothetical protein
MLLYIHSLVQHAHNIRIWCEFASQVNLPCQFGRAKAPDVGAFMQSSRTYISLPLSQIPTRKNKGRRVHHGALLFKQ